MVHGGSQLLSYPLLFLPCRINLPEPGRVTGRGGSRARWYIMIASQMGMSKGSVGEDVVLDSGLREVMWEQEEG